MPIKPKNLTAQFAHRAAGNPPSTLPGAAISNFFPGLEFDLRSIWKHIFVGVELHEAGNGTGGHQVLAVTPDSAAASGGIAVGHRLRSVDDRPVEALVVLESGPSPTLEREALEFFNSLAEVAQKPGQTARCVFSDANGTRRTVDLPVRPIFEGAAFARDLLEPGAMTQGLCSPWQADYRECGCFYWAASRPDFINVEFETGALARGHNWMQRNRGPADEYRPDNPGDQEQFNYNDLYTNWERVLKFVVGGKDSE
jgi:hypothetical protein